MKNEKLLEGLLQDQKEKQKYVIQDWLEQLNKLKVLQKFMKIDFSAVSAEEILCVAENLQQELKRCGVHQRKGELTYFDGKEIYPIK